MKTEAYYNRRDVYRKISRARKQALRKLCGKLPERARVLDIGCGGGEIAEIFQDSEGVELYGVDISEEAVKIASKRFQGAYHVDATKPLAEWPEAVRDKTFDVVIASEILEHLFDPVAFLKDIRPLLHERSSLVVTVPNLLFWKNRVKMLFGIFRYEESGILDRGHIRFFTRNTLEETLAEAGYTIEREKHVIPTRGTKWPGRLFPGLFARQYGVRASKNTTVIYTAIFGNYDALRPPRIRPKRTSFVCVTDNADTRAEGWVMKIVAPPLADPTLSARMYKTLPHRFFPEYETSVWIDGNITVRGDTSKLLSDQLSETDIAVYDHACTKGDARSSVREELDALVQWDGGRKKKEDSALMRKQVAAYEKEGFPDTGGLISSMIMLRRHNKKEVKDAMEAWWKEIETRSRRDQLSFNYAMWKTKTPFSYIREDSRDNAYFKHAPHRSI